MPWRPSVSVKLVRRLQPTARNRMIHECEDTTSQEQRDADSRKNSHGRLGPKLSTLWLTLLILASLIPNWIDADTFWGQSRVTTAFDEQAFSRVRFEYFRRLTASEQVRHPALVLVDERGTNQQLSYIVNPPDLSGDVIVCRLPEDTAIVDELTQAFPKHHLYVFSPELLTLENLIPNPTP